MDNQASIIASLSMDLKRVSLGLRRGSKGMAKRFLDEALQRRKEIKTSQLKPYLVTLLNGLDTKSKNLNSERAAEDILMYSTLFQNYATRGLNL